MRPAILAAAALGALCAAPARAQLIVNDPAHIIEMTLQWKAQFEAMDRELRQHIRTYDAIAHPTSVGGVIGAIRGASRNLMPGRGEMGGLMNGQGGEWGAAGGRLMEDRVYAPAERDEWAVEMERRERVTANAKAIAEAAIEDAQDHLDALEDINAEIEAQPDGTAVAAQAAAIQIAQQRLATHRTQAEQARLMLAAEERVARQRSEQMWRRDVDEHIEKTRGALGGW